MKAANIKSRISQRRPTCKPSRRTYPATNKSQNPCAPGTDSSSWGHPVWWGWSETSPCGQ
ncbi:hypothetical protein PSTT_03334 [Puccinia striiformis]|uniref:Uncharacterized protein n=1 Tax=Puccinia striiformis TaxID=27350 RepID=A0A2S4VWW9_9BASI|nr:hypothetical protein PSTT_03334 [Puccinia striiformis]